MTKPGKDDDEACPLSPTEREMVATTVRIVVTALTDLLVRLDPSPQRTGAIRKEVDEWLARLGIS